MLGLVWEMGPCSPYRLRRAMADSPSTQWSASAGAIYPLIRRLERGKLVASSTAGTGNRPGREYRVTPAGRAALKAWVGPPLPPEAITVVYDPLRSRARFVGLLTPAQRRAWLRSAHAALDTLAERVEAWHAANSGKVPAADILTAHGRTDVRARRSWLKDAEKHVGKV